MQVFKALSLAMLVVADESTTGVDDDSTDDGIYRAGGPTNANSTVQPLYKSTVEGVDEGDGVTVEDMDFDDLQRLVVGGWLLVKEGAALLSKLVQILPIPVEVDAQDALADDGAYDLSSSTELEVLSEQTREAIGGFVQMAKQWNDTSNTAQALLSSSQVRAVQIHAVRSTYIALDRL
jgi:hypothetical protein